MLTSAGRPYRRSIRFRGFDYRQSAMYFVTICSHGRRPLFRTPDTWELSDFGRVVGQEWLRTATLREAVVLDEFVIMPDHLHALLYLRGDVERCTRVSLGEIIAGFKAAVTSRCRSSTGIADLRIWQRNYYEHVVRTDRAADLIREYIRVNPERWPAEPCLRLPLVEFRLPGQRNSK